MVLVTGLLMVSSIRYPHLVNRHLRGRRPIGRLLFMLVMVLLMLIAHRYTLGIGSLLYVILTLAVPTFAARRRATSPGGSQGQT